MSATTLVPTGLESAIREHHLTAADVALYLRLRAAEHGRTVDPVTCARVAANLCATAHRTEGARP